MATQTLPEISFEALQQRCYWCARPTPFPTSPQQACQACREDWFSGDAARQTRWELNVKMRHIYNVLLYIRKRTFYHKVTVKSSAHRPTLKVEIERGTPGILRAPLVEVDGLEAEQMKLVEETIYCASECSYSLTYLRPIIHTLFPGAEDSLEEIEVALLPFSSNVAWGHWVLRYRAPNGLEYALDLTGSQFTSYQRVWLWPEYARELGINVQEEERLGYCWENLKKWGLQTLPNPTDLDTLRVGYGFYQAPPLGEETKPELEGVERVLADRIFYGDLINHVETWWKSILAQANVEMRCPFQGLFN